MADITNSKGGVVKGTSSADNIYNTGYYVRISAGKGNDSINNGQRDSDLGGTFASINAGLGNDYVFNRSRNVTIFGGAGRDDIDNLGKNARIFGDADNDYITNSGLNSFIDAGAGNDTVYNDGSNVSIAAGDGNDSIDNHADNVTINGGAGNDTIFNDGDNMSINGGAGNDTLYSYMGGFFKYSDGDGNDLIRGFDSLSTLQIIEENGSYSTQESGDDLIVTVGKGKITLKGAASLPSVNIEALSSTLRLTDSSSSPVTLESSVKKANASSLTTAVNITANDLDNTILGGRGDDTLAGGTGNDYLQGDMGNDSLWGGAGKDKLIGGAGNDQISGDSGNDTLSGHSGNDRLWGDAGNDSLWGGEGDDTIYGGDGSDTFVYQPGNDGTDTIMDYRSGDLLKIFKTDGSEGGSFTEATFSSNKLTLEISGGGSVVFNNVSASDTFNINCKSYKVSGSTLK